MENRKNNQENIELQDFNSQHKYNEQNNFTDIYNKSIEIINDFIK